MGARNYEKILALLMVFVLYLKTAHCLKCYRCDSSDNKNIFQCNEYLSEDIDLEPQSCDDVYGAKYCVKQSGRFEGFGLNCYQCASETEWKCGDGEMITEALHPVNCSHVYDAKFCIKTIGRFGGGIGTRRYCSSKDMGNYCKYVNQPGDQLKYRTCVFTCTGDGCNAATKTTGPIDTILWILSIGILSLNHLF